MIKVLEPLPEPEKKLKQFIDEAAAKDHESSEEDEIHVDRNFVEHSNKLIRDLITENISSKKIS